MINPKSLKLYIEESALITKDQVNIIKTLTKESNTYLEIDVLTINKSEKQENIIGLTFINLNKEINNQAIIDELAQKIEDLNIHQDIRTDYLDYLKHLLYYNTDKLTPKALNQLISLYNKDFQKNYKNKISKSNLAKTKLLVSIINKAIKNKSKYSSRVL